MLFFKQLDYEVVAKQDSGFTVRIKGKSGQTITVDEAVGEVILDLNNDQYNADHRFYRHQDSFFQAKSTEVEVDPFASLADRSSIEACLLYTSPSPRDRSLSRMPSSA